MKAGAVLAFNSLLEKRIAELYRRLSDVVKDSTAKVIFRFIGADSMKHSEVLKALAEELGYSDTELNEFVGEYRDELVLLDQIGESITNMANSDDIDIKILLETLMMLERVEHHTRGVEELLRECGRLGDETFNKVCRALLSSIRDDEVRHFELVRLIRIFYREMGEE